MPSRLNDFTYSPYGESHTSQVEPTPQIEATAPTSKGKRKLSLDDTRPSKSRKISERESLRLKWPSALADYLSSVSASSRQSTAGSNSSSAQTAASIWRKTVNKTRSRRRARKSAALAGYPVNNPTDEVPSYIDDWDSAGPVNATTLLNQQHAPQASFTHGPVPPPPAPESQAAVPGTRVHFRPKITKTTYGDLTKDRPLANVCLPLDVEISVAELMIFFPNSMQIPLMAKRLMRNGFPGQTLAKVQLDAVNKLTDKNVTTTDDRLKRQFKAGGECEYADKKQANRTMWDQIAKADGPHLDLTANQFKLRCEYAYRDELHHWGHCKLSDVYGPVDASKWPQGNDRLVLTQCLDFAQANPHLDLDTSHWACINQQINPQPPPFPAGYKTRDHEALERFCALYPTKKAI